MDFQAVMQIIKVSQGGPCSGVGGVPWPLKNIRKGAKEGNEGREEAKCPTPNWAMNEKSTFRAS
jgi:hypothetical protein